MRRDYRQKPGEVVERRIESAARTRGKPVDAMGNRALALLAVYGDGRDGFAARRAVARYLTWQPHGCKGRKCGYGVHAGHLAVRDELLDVLGLAGERR